MADLAGINFSGAGAIGLSVFKYVASDVLEQLTAYVILLQ